MGCQVRCQIILRGSEALSRDAAAPMHEQSCIRMLLLFCEALLVMQQMSRLLCLSFVPYGQSFTRHFKLTSVLARMDKRGMDLVRQVQVR
jgi:hypothetical protein